MTEYFHADPQFCLVAEAPDEQIVGFILGTSYEKEGSPWKYGYISWLGVVPEARRKGLGQRLYAAVERRMREEGIRMILLDTEAANNPAMAFFRSLGFTPRRSHVWLGKTLSPSRRQSAGRGRLMSTKGPTKRRLPRTIPVNDIDSSVQPDVQG